MITTLCAVAGGGALGALARHGVNVTAAHFYGANFPFGTLAVNILGSFLMGVLITVFALAWQPSEALKLLLVTGFLGAFTTFSTFSLDFVQLWERGETSMAVVYMMSSVLLSIGALISGMIFIRWVYV